MYPKALTSRFVFRPPHLAPGLPRFCLSGFHPGFTHSSPRIHSLWPRSTGPKTNGAHKMYFLCKTNPMSSHHKINLTDYARRSYVLFGHLVNETNKPKQTQFSTHPWLPRVAKTPEDLRSTMSKQVYPQFMPKVGSGDPGLSGNPDLSGNNVEATRRSRPVGKRLTMDYWKGGRSNLDER
jgi:hypothetical protein